MSLSKMVSESGSAPAQLEEIDEVVLNNGNGGSEMEVVTNGNGGTGMEGVLEVLTKAAEAFESLAWAGVKVDGNHGEKLRNVRKKLELEGGTTAELRDQLRTKDGVIVKLSEKYTEERKKRIWAEFEFKKMRAAWQYQQQPPRVEEEVLEGPPPLDLFDDVDVVPITMEEELPPSPRTRSEGGKLVGEARRVVAEDSSANLPGTSKSFYNLRRRSSNVNAKVGWVAVSSDEESDEVGDDTGDEEESAAGQLTKGKRSIPGGTSSGRKRTGPANCGPWNLVFSSHSNLSRHLRNVHANYGNGSDQVFPCRYCNRSFAHRRLLSLHNMTHPAEQRYVCKTCGSVSKNRDSYRAHLKIHDPNRERKFACSTPNCNYATFTRKDLASHRLCHTSNKAFSCPRCPTRFKREPDVKKHLRRMHFVGRDVSDTNPTPPASK